MLVAYRYAIGTYSIKPKESIMTALKKGLFSFLFSFKSFLSLLSNAATTVFSGYWDRSFT